MSRVLKCTALLCAAVALAACGSSDEDELRQWMQEQRANARPRVIPIEEPKEFKPQDYIGSGDADPYSPQRLTQALRRDSNQTASNAALIAPELARRKEPLESFPTDAMTMVGYLVKADGPTALLKVDNLIYPVKRGNYLGLNYGKIVKISETAIELREIVQDSTGDWIERHTTLDLQEGKQEGKK
ncbi:MAG: pilus assembly protein PilP [Comamonadaceae bacterium]|jgi:type IV pilus assembly protein PilP|nr:pilus assembly protein PilP [Comamonadaceae bacterium]